MLPGSWHSNYLGGMGCHEIKQKASYRIVHFSAAGVERRRRWWRAERERKKGEELFEGYSQRLKHTSLKIHLRKLPLIY
jgi:hypothetical protein